jgi:hypothetical protein
MLLGTLAHVKLLCFLVTSPVLNLLFEYHLKPMLTVKRTQVFQQQ